MMLSGRRFRVELTDAQERLAQQTADACRAVYNTGLEQRRAYRRRGVWINYEQQAHELVDAKAENAWLREVPGHCLQQTLMDLDTACRKRGTFNVRWRSARRWVPSFRFPEGAKIKLQKLNRRKSQVTLPKLGWVKFRASRGLDGQTIRSETLTREGAHWFVSLLVEDGITTPAEHARPGTTVGWIAGWRLRWPPAPASCSTRCSPHRVSGGAPYDCNANCAAPPRVRRTAARPRKPSPSYGRVSGAAAKISALRPRNGWRTKTQW